MRPRTTPSDFKAGAPDRSDHEPVKESDGPSPNQLIRLLAGLALKAESVHPQDVNDHCEEVLVDAELDGFRYLLVRMPKPTSNRVSLSPREQEIVRMVAQGHPNKVIAGVLNISGWTVCTHLRRIFAKLGVGSRAAMVARMHEVGTMDHRMRPAADGPSSSTAAPQPGAESNAYEQKLAARSGRR